MGKDAHGYPIECEYSFTREARGGSRLRDSSETLAFDIRDCKVTSRGEFWYDYTGQSDLVREPNQQELYHFAAWLANGGKYGDIWAKRHVVQGFEPKESSDDPGRLHDAEPGEPTPKVPYCPPGHVLIPIVSTNSSVNFVDTRTRYMYLRF